MAATITQKRNRRRGCRRDLRPAAMIGNAETYLYRSLQASPEAVRGARASLSELLSKNAVDDCAKSRVLLCVQEALTNAISHAGECGRIGLSVQLGHGDLTMEVRDRGGGFDAAGLEPTAEPDLMSEHGRGLFLIRQLMDDVQITSDGDGTTVRMVLMRDRRPAPRPWAS